ncbi:MAG: Crp/Fnr family transcriptional regulator [Gammaproteobacteria bacterium]
MNQLLTSLGPRVLPQMLSACDEVELTLGAILWEPGLQIRQVYFPMDSIISQSIPVGNHENLEVGLVGNEGMLGIPLLLGVDFSLLQSLVQAPGLAQRMEAAAFLHALGRFPELRHRLNRYVYVSFSQLARGAACNSFHALDARLARRLLSAHDRAGGGNFHITQKFLARMMGDRRVGVTNAAGLLQKRHLIRYHRGEITVLDRAGLEAASCECYQRSIDTYRQILG